MDRFPIYRFNRGVGEVNETLTAEELEAKLIEYLHGDFILLLGLCKYVITLILYQIPNDAL